MSNVPSSHRRPGTKSVLVSCTILCLAFGNRAFASSAASQPSHITNSIGMPLVFIPAGSFLMGSPPQEEAPPAFKAIEKERVRFLL